MGGTLGCFLGAVDESVEYTLVSGQYQSLGGRRSGDEKSFLKSQSTTWCSSLNDENASSVKTRTLGYDSDEDHEFNSEQAMDSSTANDATSGSRLLNNFYNLVLECDHSKFFIDSNGNPVKGPYLQEIEMIQNYFDTEREQMTATRRRRRSSVDTTSIPKHSIWYQPSVSTWSTMSSDTSATMSCDSDYWSLIDTFMQADECPSLSTVEPERMLYPCEYTKDPMPMPLFSPVKSTSCNSFQRPIEKLIKRPSFHGKEEATAKTNAARRSSLSRAAASHTIVPVAS